MMRNFISQSSFLEEMSFDNGVFVQKCDKNKKVEATVSHHKLTFILTIYDLQ